MAALPTFHKETPTSLGTLGATEVPGDCGTHQSVAVAVEAMQGPWGCQEEPGNGGWGGGGPAQVWQPLKVLVPDLIICETPKRLGYCVRG